MRQSVSKFQVYQDSVKSNKYFANLADENVLLLTHQRLKGYTDLTDRMMDHIASAAPSLTEKRTPLQDYLGGKGRKRVIDSDYVKWRLKGTGETQAVQLENVMPGDSCPGIQASEFAIKLDVEWYVDGDIIAPDIAKECQVLVQGLPVADGGGFIYNVVVVSDDLTDFFPPELLSVGIKWIKIGAAYSEASRGYGSTILNSGMPYVEFQSNLTDYGKSIEVTNKAHDLNFRVRSCDEKGAQMKDYPDQIISAIEMKFRQQARWEKELMLFYGRSSGKQIIDHTSGHYRRIGPGLLEFLEEGNVIPYPLKGGSIDMFVNYLQSIWFDRVSPSQRNITIYTGQGGMTLWNNWITEKYNQSATPGDFKTFVGSGKSYDPKNYKGLKFQTAYFTEYNIFPFGSIRVEHWDILDSMYLNGGTLHPETGLPLSSYQFIVLDYGLGNGGGSNIELLERKDSEVYEYLCGTWSPLGAINRLKGNSRFRAAHTGRSYQLVHACTFGLRVKDTSLTAIFTPACASL